MYKITEDVYVGSSYDIVFEEVLLHQNIKSVVVVAKDYYSFPNYNTISIYHQGIVAGPGNIPKHLDKIVNIVEWLQDFKQKCIIVCHDGTDRSPIAAAAVLSKKENISFDKAWSTVVKASEQSIHPVKFASQEARKSLIELGINWYKSKRVTHDI